MSQSHEPVPRQAEPLAITVPERLALPLRALGAAGEAWLADLPSLLAGLESDWSITVGTPLAGGQGAYVAEAVTHDGTPVVVKVLLPPGIDALTPFDRELTALRLVGGDPYVELIRHDVPRRALLLERLGAPMASLNWPAARQTDALARLAARAWRPAPVDRGLPTGAESARWLADFITSKWEDLDRPCPEATVDQAITCTTAREAAFDPRHATLVHGDVHAFNALRTSSTGFRLVDPEGLASEPAHDLGGILARGVQGWTDELAASTPARAVAMMAHHCDHTGGLTGTDPTAIRQWAFTELVSTGLFLLSLGRHDEAETYLAAATTLT